MPILVRLFSILALVFPLTACVSVNTVTLYKTSTSNNTKSAMAGDGIAFLAGNACIHVADRGAEIHTIAANDYKSPTEIFKVAVWVIPERGTDGYSLNPSQMALTFDDGTTTMPQSVQISKFNTKWEKEKTLLVTPKENEKIAYANHEPRKQGT